MKKEKTYLVLSVAEFLEDTAKGTLLHAVLLASKSSDLSRWTCASTVVSQQVLGRKATKGLTADENLGLLAEVRGSEMLLDEVPVDEARRAYEVERMSVNVTVGCTHKYDKLTFPVGLCFVDGVDDVEGLGVFLLERVELLLEEDILLRQVGKE